MGFSWAMLVSGRVYLGFLGCSFESLLFPGYSFLQVDCFELLTCFYLFSSVFPFQTRCIKQSRSQLKKSPNSFYPKNAN